MKIYSASEMFAIRLKKFFSLLPGAIVASAVAVLLLIMLVNEEMGIDICADVFAFGMAALAGRVGYFIAKTQYEKECMKHKRQQRTSKRSA